jgi:hypothetical protein
MSRVRFHAGDIDLELSGSEPFVLRQLQLLSTLLGGVDADALADAEPVEEVAPPRAKEPAQVAEEPAPETPAAPANGGPSLMPGPANGEADELLRFYAGFRPQDLDRQSDAALLFAYYLQRREGLPSLQLGDLIRCCIRAGVDTRNFNRTLGILTRRGYLEAVRAGHGYRLSDHGVAAVESRM